MFSSNKSAILLVLQLSLCFLAAVNAIPLRARQSADGAPKTITTTNTYQNGTGLMTETCMITLTPLTDGSGNMQEIQSCSTAPAAPGATVGNSTSVGSTASSSAPGTSPTPAPANGVQAGVVANGGSSSIAPSSTSASSAPTPAANNAGTAPVVGDSEAAVKAPFQIPGRSLLIPPIGLGIFCGITGIGILFWTFVTFERIRYRKTFRKRKLAEEAAPMGYGGMASGIKA